MTIAQFLLAVLRLLLVGAGVVLTARRIRRRWIGGDVPGATALVDAVVAVAVLLVEAEALGIVGILRAWTLVGAAVAVAAGVYGASTIAARRGHRPTTTRTTTPAPAPAPAPRSSAAARSADGGRRTMVAALAIAAAILASGWLLASANSLGGGMFNFDTLWYHMPFAAAFAHSGSVTAIHFTQADPYVAYYPANSELVHAIGIALVGGDVLSPVINLGWLALALLAAWRLGARWGTQPETLLAGIVVLGLPVMSASQPGEAFNDTMGLALMLAAAALLVDPGLGRRRLVPVGLALGLTAGVKYTFLVPAFVLWLGALLMADGERSSSPPRRAALVTVPLLVTGGWWYLRNVIDTTNPLGLQLHAGPITIPGPVSLLANSQSQTVLSQLEHVSLWTSRFVPGLAHGLGPLWPLVLAAALAGIVGGLASGDRWLGLLAGTAAGAAMAYLVFPTGATNIEQNTTLFEVNLRYITPALLLALPVLAVVLGRARPAWRRAFASIALAVLVAAQFERSLWPAQLARHAAFLAGCVAAGALAVGWRRARGHLRPRRLRSRRLRSSGQGAGRVSPVRLVNVPVAVAAGTVLAVTVCAGAYALQRHYYARRYLVGASATPGYAAVYRWAQRVSHARIALYGGLEQYPLYGARDTNTVLYLGQPAAHGGYARIANCRTWREVIDRGRFDYVVLTPVPLTGPVPPQWTLDDRAAKVVLHPATFTWVVALDGAMDPATCP